MRLDKFLCETTDLTRSLAKKALHRGEVSVDGEMTKNSAMHVDENNTVQWLGERLTPFGLRYLMMNKPEGIECTTRAGRYPTVLELIDLPKVERLRPVGRLDVDTTGLILLTDDGQWSHRITSPRTHCPKVYLATLAEPLEGSALDKAIATFAEGMLLEGEQKPTQPAQLEALASDRFRITVTDGKYHQVRRMFAALGNRVDGLHRESVGPLSLDPDLEPGECRMLRDEEIAAF